MDRTSNFITQHKELVEVVTAISEHLEIEKIKETAEDVRSLLSKLSGKIKIHLVMEDKVLYPYLLKSTDEKIVELTKKYISEMGNIKTAFGEYSTKWANPMDIKNDPESFISETKGVFKVLAERIGKENNELYPLVDKLG